MPWGDFLHSGTVKVKGRTEPLAAWRDTSEGRSSQFDRAGTNHVRAHVKDLTILRSRPTVPPPSHVEAPSA